MNLAKYIDHTILKPDTKIEDIQVVCKEAIENEFYSVCVNPYYVETVKKYLVDTNVKVTSVIGFPLGTSTTEIKALETRKAIEDGADEIDMVINVSALKNKDYDFVLNDIKSVVNELKSNNILKVIIETCLLSDDEKIKACELAESAGANFVKTSTGFSKSGATEDDVKLMKTVVGDRLKVKASGGIRDYEKAIKMIKAGASRLGTSASVEIINGEVSDSDY